MGVLRIFPLVPWIVSQGSPPGSIAAAVIGRQYRRRRRESGKLHCFVVPALIMKSRFPAMKWQGRSLFACLLDLA